MQSVLRDIRFEFRQLMRKPGFAVVAILTLALGAGANALMFTVIDSILLRPLPYPAAQQLIKIDSTQSDGAHGSTSLPNLLDVESQSRSFTGIAGYNQVSVSLRLPSGEAAHAVGTATQANLFEVLGIRPMLGHTFLAGQDQPGKPCSVVLSAEFWRGHLSGDRHVLGQNLTVDGQSCDIAGVMPDGFAFPSRHDQFWIPLRRTPVMMDRGASFLNIIGRLNSGATLEFAQSEFMVIARRLAKAYPNENTGVAFVAESYKDTIVGDARPALLVLLGAVGVLLLIGCANIANLQLARALGRKREMAIRAALGAGRIRVARQLITENLLLALMGTTVGLLLASGLLDLLKRLAADAIPRASEIELRPEVCLATLVVASLSAVLFGLAPVWQAAHQDIETSLRESTGAVAGGRKQQRLRDLLVVTQLGLAITLVAGSALLLRTLNHLLNTDRGFATEHILTLQTSLPGTEPASQNLATTIYGPEIDQIEQIPGVKAAGFITFIPLGHGRGAASFLIGGDPPPSPEKTPHSALNAISEDYFSALQVPLLNGRYFKKSDALSTRRVAIVNDAFGKQYFTGRDPIGKKIAFEEAESQSNPIVIVGVVRGSRQTELAKPPDPELYLSIRQVPPATMWSDFLLKQNMTYVVRSSGEATAVSNDVERVIHRVNPAQTVFHVATMQEIVSDSVQSPHLAALLLSVFAGLALIVSAMGLYGVLSYMVTQRTRDIAVRMAVGARQEDVVRMVVGRAVAPYGIGLVVGFLGVAASGHLLSSLVEGVQTWDPVALGGTTVVLMLVALAAAWLPARRAASIDPYEALRSE